MACAKEIEKVDGVDGVFFGPADISADFGKLGTTMDPEVWVGILKAADLVRSAGKPVGTFGDRPGFRH